MALNDPFKLKMITHTTKNAGKAATGNYKAPRMSPKGKDPAPKQQEKFGLKN